MKSLFKLNLFIDKRREMLSVEENNIVSLLYVIKILHSLDALVRRADL